MTDHRTATLQIVWSPPDPRFDNPPDRGGHLYRVRNPAHGDRVHICGTNGRGPNYDGALDRARAVALRAGYTNYLVMGMIGPPAPLY